MKNLFDKEAATEIINRLQTLKPESQRQWGKMDVAQMLAHCTASMEVATARKFPPRIFIGKLIGGFFKSAFLNDKPFQKNSPTDKSFIFTDKRNFEEERKKLITIIKDFSEGGSQKCTNHPHSFFGKLTPIEWATGMYKHLDHHLRQFNA